MKKGKGFSSMETTLLKRPQAKQAASGQPGRQFFVQAAGGDMKQLRTPRSDKKVSPVIGSVMKGLISRTWKGKIGL